MRHVHWFMRSSWCHLRQDGEGIAWAWEFAVHYHSATFPFCSCDAQGLQQLYTAVVLAIIVLNVVMQMNPNFGSEKWRLRRSLTYGAVIAFGVSRPTFVAWNQL